MKKVLIIAGVALVLYMLIMIPSGSADVVHKALGGLGDGANSFTIFLKSLFNVK